MDIKVKRAKGYEYGIPQYMSVGASGMDLRANIKNPLKIKSLERIAIATGISLEIPSGYEVQVRSRSGLVEKYGLTVLNSPGTIDSDYRGEIKVIIANLSKDTYIMKPGERIAQMVVSKVERVNLVEAKSLSTTSRGSGGLGHTGVM